MKSLLNISAQLLLLVSIASSIGCTRAAYERLEERSLPKYQQGVPVLSKLEKVCRVNGFHEVGNFLLSYDQLWDMTNYPTYPNNPPRWEARWCDNSGVNNVRYVDLKDSGNGYAFPHISYRDDEVIKSSECISYSSPNVCSKLGERKANIDPSKGALKAWPLIGISMDGLNWKSLMVNFSAVIVEGDKMPLGGIYSGVFNKYNEDRQIIEKLNINNREWEHFTYKPFVDPTRQDGRLAGTAELYKTKIGNHTLFVKAGYAHQITNNPDWLAKRRVFLLQWVETFKIEPLPADYKKTQ